MTRSTSFLHAMSICLLCVAILLGVRMHGGRTMTWPACAPGTALWRFAARLGREHEERPTSTTAAGLERDLCGAGAMWRREPRTTARGPPHARL